MIYPLLVGVVGSALKRNDPRHGDAAMDGGRERRGKELREFPFTRPVDEVTVL
jgi:hypothetical protein